MNLIDTHVHLDELEDIEGALARAQESGIMAIIAVGSDLTSNKKILELAGQYPGFVFPALGLHPWRLKAEELESNFSFIEQEIPGCLALGEIGLDFAIATPRIQQGEILQRLLAIALKEEKPVLLHARRAWTEVLSLLRIYPVRKAVFHWYSGPLELLQEIFQKGFYISATPAAAYSERHRRAIQAAPISQLLLETDSPEVYQGEKSEPKDLLTALHYTSKLKSQDPENIAAQTFINAQQFFGLDLQ